MHHLICLRPLTINLLDAMIAGDRHATIRSGLQIEPGYQTNPGLLPLTRSLLADGRTTAPWILWGVVADHQRLVGIAGFLGAPDEDGGVTLTVGIAPSCRGRGYASAAVGLLLGIASGHDDVRIVRAYTSSPNDSAAAVLSRNQFRRASFPSDGRSDHRWLWYHPITRNITAPTPIIGIAS